MQTCLRQSSDIVSGMETKWRPTVEAESTELGLAGLPGGRKAKMLGNKEGAEHRRDYAQIHLGGCGRADTVPASTGGAKEEAAGFD